LGAKKRLGDQQAENEERKDQNECLNRPEALSQGGGWGGVAWGVRELSADAKSLIWQRPVWARVAGEFGWARQVR